MSSPYPSRRELRLQREREERAVLRDQEAQRWAEEVEDHQQRAAGAKRQANETLATVEPVPASQATETQPDSSDSDDLESLGEQEPAGRRAANTPVDAPADIEEPVPEVAPRRHRRADSQVTATGMLPVITKQRQEREPSKPRSRREARKHAERFSAERQVEIDDLKAQQAQQDQPVPPKPAKPVRRATAPQAPPPPIPAVEPASEPVDEPVETDAGDEAPADNVVLSTSELYGESATEITDMSGLDTLEIRRVELREETERLTQEIIELGQEDPNVIDPLLLRRQKELAEKSQELQDLETAAISVVEEQQDSDATDVATTSAPAKTLGDDTVAEETDEAGASDDEDGPKPKRRARRASSGPSITGPFEVADDNETNDVAPAETKPEFSEHFASQPETESVPVTGPEQPLDASSAHGLDTLDPKESEAPERFILTISVVVFAIGIIALIVALILLTR